VRIAYDDQGRGEPALIFLPGWCSSRAGFAGLPSRCSASRRTLVLDWRGHGDSGSPAADFGQDGLVTDVLAVVEASGVGQIIPVALAHAGWVAIELRRRLGVRVPGLVLVDWLVLDAPPPFLAALKALQDPDRWRETRDRLFATWLHGLDHPAVARFVTEDMGAHDFAMWARAGREIARAYARHRSPLQALARLAPPPVLHLYAQPDDPGYLAAQRTFADSHPWFHVQKLAARSHFPMFEVPDQMAAAIESFVGP
jgi:pimeloyl-ACP methyl ester carboxylesterase